MSETARGREGMFKLVVKWREIPFSTQYEISSEGSVRNTKTRKVRQSQGPIGYTGTDGKRKSMPMWKVHETVWPEYK